MDIHDIFISNALEELNTWLRQLIPRDEFVKAKLPLHLYPNIHQPNVVRGTDKKAVLLHFLDKIFLFLYRRVPISIAEPITIFSWVMTYGFGDLIAQYEIGKIIKKRFPDIFVYLVSLIHKSAYLDMRCTGDECIRIPFNTNADMHVENFPKKVFSILRSSALVMQTPTFYPMTSELWEKVRQLEPKTCNPFPKQEILGEYGFSKAAWAHPNLEARSLGLHFLEKGILTKTIDENLNIYAFSHLSRSVLKHLFYRSTISKAYLESYFNQTLLLFAYLITDEGLFVYLQAMLIAFKADERDIIFALTDIGGFLRAWQKWPRDFDELFRAANLQEVQITYHDNRSIVFRGKPGKRLKIVHLGSIAPEDFQRLLSLSCGVYGCRGDQSFSYAISAGKPFFYDGLSHAEPFLLDLLDIAKIKFPHSADVCRSIEISLELLNEKSDFNRLGKELGAIFSSSDFYAEMEQFCGFIEKNYSANELIGDIVARGLYHYYHPAMENYERMIKRDLLEGKISFFKAIELCKQKLEQS